MERSVPPLHFCSILRHVPLSLAARFLYPLPSMVDVHCHLLYGLDDGAKSLGESIQMAEMAIADGITHVIGTPHSNAEYAFNAVLIRERRDELQAQLGGRLQLATGCDFHLSLDNIQSVKKHPTRYTLNQKNYLLVEFADFAIPPSTDETLHGLHLLGLKLIITHPERNGLIRHQPEKLWKWMRLGCYVQVTAQSLTGRFGRDAQHAAEEWMMADRIHFFASDAHDTKNRPLILSEAYKIVAKKRGEEVANALFTENPLAAFEGRPLPYQPEPPAEENAASGFKKRKRFIFF
jgi:protein-tyrosine phosphatase